MLSVTVDPSGALAHFADVKENQIPFAVSQSINDTAKEFQRVQIAHDASVFAQRRGPWQAQSIKITHFATKAANWATIGVHPPGAGGDDRADILAKFEDDTEKTPFRGRYVPIPTIFIKRTKSDVVPASLFPSQLHLHSVGNRIVGDQRTFLIHTKAGQPIILQRIGKGGRSMTAAIWTFAPFVRITPDLDFAANALATIDSGWRVNFERRFADAMATAK